MTNLLSEERIQNTRKEMVLNNMFADLVEQSSDIILVTDDNFQIKYVNQSIYRILGLTKEEVEGKLIFDFIVPSKEGVLRSFLSKSLSTAKASDFIEVCIPCKDKKPIHFDVSITDLFDNNSVNGLVMTLHDVTKRKEIEYQLIKANNELDHFMYKTSHDLRAPLLSSLGLVDLAQRDRESNKYEYLRMIEMNLKKLDAFIEDINSFYRNERLVIGREIVDMKRSINEEINRLSMLYDTSSINVQLKVNRISDFYSDKARVKTVLNNILSNAIKYMDKHKARKKIDIIVQVMPDLCQVTVEDNGIGIREKYLNKIYKIFYRADENAKGSGLGLYIAKNTIEKLGGKINVSSKYGVGTKFTIILPNLVNAPLTQQDITVS
ncbi:MAG: PAS domain-containing sensor histidine kinase [Bacteroidota bacterium]